MNGLEKAVNIAGSQQKLAKLIGVTQQHVSAWANKRVPAERCRAITKATGVTIFELRPDLFEDY